MEGADAMLSGTEIGLMMVSPLRVMIDARMLIGRFSGVSRFVTRLVDELAKRDDVEVVALCGKEVFPAWRDRRNIEVIRSDFGRRHRTALKRLSWEETRLRGFIRSARVDIFHATWNTGVPARCTVPTVLTIHDLIPWHDPKRYFATSMQRWCYRYSVRASASRASCITTVSDYVRRDVLNELGLPPEKVAAVPNGVDMPNLQSPIPNLKSPIANPPFVLYVGGHETRKNVAGLFEAMRRYWEQFGSTLELRLTGEASSLSQEAAQAYRRLPNKERVCFLGHVDDAELTRQYFAANMLLILSRDEGFGLPVVEAMAHGCPVVAASRAALPEVIGDAGLLVDPEDLDAVVRAIHLLLTDSGLRQRLIELGRGRAQSFTWRAAADRLKSLYDRALPKPGMARTGTAAAAAPA